MNKTSRTKDPFNANFSRQPNEVRCERNFGVVTLKADCEQRAQDGTDEVSAEVPFNANNQAGEHYGGSDCAEQKD